MGEIHLRPNALEKFIFLCKSFFEKKVFAFESEFNEERQALSIEIMNFLSQWLVSHIKGSDKKYGPFLKQRGLK